MNIDRYIPGQDTGASVMTVNPLQDPFKLQFQVGFSYFGEWWRANEKIKAERERIQSGRPREPERVRGQRESQEERDREKAKIQVAYDAYKEELQAKMAKQFVQEHKNEQWFQERYVAEVRDPLREKLNDFRRGNYSTWERDLDDGKFDEFSLEGIPKSEVNGSGNPVEKEEGETTAANEILGVGDLLPTAGSDIRDEQAFQPTLLIKTIAPQVNREKLIDFCKEHLGEGEGGFRWLSLSDPNPSKRYHRIGWVMLNPATETADYRPDPNDEEAEEASPPLTQRSTAENALEAINGKQVKDEVRGDFTCHVGVHVPPLQPRKKALWDLFSAPERIEKDLQLATKLIKKLEEELGSDCDAIQKIEEKVNDLRSQGLLKPTQSAPTKAKKDESMDDIESGEEGEEQEDEGAIDDDIDDEELLVKKKQLDLMVEYLRRVFNFCFFCVFESDSIHELTRKCPGGHLRRPRNTLTSASKAAARASASGDPFPAKTQPKTEDGDGSNSPEAERKSFSRPQVSKTEQQLQRAFNWVKTFEEKIQQILEPETADVRKLGGRPVDEAVDEELLKYVKQEDEHKFRCKVPECTKLFKEEHFWRKHVDKRHTEWLEALKKDVSISFRVDYLSLTCHQFELVNTYVLDPAHIAPSRSDANSNGHFPPANGHQPTGTPRGFNLNSMGMNGMPPMPGFGGAPFFGGHQVQMPNGWMPGGDGGGPMRRGGGRFQNQRSGPYDRRPGGRSWNNQESGRLSPPGGRPGARPGSTGGAPGPREAVAGRSLKSYEDLDAVAGNGGGELNY
jgi:uncharacterized C2H2 Zn-finger protein